MEQLGIALAGVLVGAFVTEGLRTWRRRVEMTRCLRGAKRLIRNELIANSTMLTGNDATPPVIRERINCGSIGLGRWTANEVLLAESLPAGEWQGIAAANVLLRMVIADIDLTDDDTLKAVATDLGQMLDKATPRM